ncbi:MAG: XisH family protein [Pseudanabaena sp. CAN_BIN31]|nr:XisH family protein [Pseudanabaena sp. CAN_BIN31]
MSAKDKFHDIVKRALIKDGWQITDDPLFLRVGGIDFFIDLGADNLLAAEMNGSKIAIEIKSFINTSAITDFHLAIGQFINYRTALKLKEPDRKLFLAMPEIAYDSLFQKEFPQIIVDEYQIGLLIYDIENEVIAKWIP